MSSDEEIDEHVGVEASNSNIVEGAEETIPPRPLDKDIIAGCISMVHRLGYGFSHAYVNLNCSMKSLDNIDVLRSYIHLRFITLSNNSIRDLSPLSEIGHLIYLQADNNRIESIDCLNKLKYLQHLDVTDNRISSFINLDLPILTTLKIGRNKLQSLASDPYPPATTRLCSLTVLDVHGNELKSLKGIEEYPTLRELYCGDNGLQSLGAGLSNLTQLTRLHARGNALSELDGFKTSLGKLTYVNLRENKIRKFSEIATLKVLANLKTIRLGANPISRKQEYRSIVAALLPNTDDIDKRNVFDYTREAGVKYMKENPNYDDELSEMTSEETSESLFPASGRKEDNEAAMEETMEEVEVE